MHLPHIADSIPIFCFNSSLAFFLHLKGSINSSLDEFIFHSLPLIADAGQASVHLVHFQQLDVFIGLSVIRGISVKIEDKRSADPYSVVISRALLPIHPNPPRVATVL